MKTIKRPQPRPVPREAAEAEAEEVEDGGCTVLYCTVLYCTAQDQEVEERGEQQSQDRERLMFYLAVAYCANIGGTGTLTAEETNIIIMVSS